VRLNLTRWEVLGVLVAPLGAGLDRDDCLLSGGSRWWGEGRCEEGDGVADEAVVPIAVSAAVVVLAEDDDGWSAVIVDNGRAGLGIGFPSGNGELV